MNLVYICVCVFVFVGVGLTEFLCHQQISVPSKACLLSAGFFFFIHQGKKWHHRPVSHTTPSGRPNLFFVQSQ